MSHFAGEFDSFPPSSRYASSKSSSISQSGFLSFVFNCAWHMVKGILSNCVFTVVSEQFHPRLLGGLFPGVCSLLVSVVSGWPQALMQSQDNSAMAVSARRSCTSHPIPLSSTGITGRGLPESAFLSAQIQVRWASSLGFGGPDRGLTECLCRIESKRKG